MCRNSLGPALISLGSSLTSAPEEKYLFPLARIRKTRKSLQVAKRRTAEDRPSSITRLIALCLPTRFSTAVRIPSLSLIVNSESVTDIFQSQFNCAYVACPMQYPQ